MAAHLCASSRSHKACWPCLREGRRFERLPTRAAALAPAVAREHVLHSSKTELSCTARRAGQQVGFQYRHTAMIPKDCCTNQDTAAGEAGQLRERQQALAVAQALSPERMCSAADLQQLTALDEVPALRRQGLLDWPPERGVVKQQV